MNPDTHRAEIGRQIGLLIQTQKQLNGEITPPEFPPEIRLVEDLGLDSLLLLNLALEVENRWQIVLGETPEDPPRTLSDLTDLVVKAISAKGTQ